MYNPTGVVNLRQSWGSEQIAAEIGGETSATYIINISAFIDTKQLNHFSITFNKANSKIGMAKSQKYFL